jgi:hypothetical protein
MGRGVAGTGAGGIGTHPILATPDGKYIVVRKRLWRASNPALPAATRKLLTKNLMAARRAIKTADPNSPEMQRARAAVHAAKTALGERGPVWWEDGAPDYNRHLVHNTPYAAWFEIQRRAPDSFGVSAEPGDSGIVSVVEPKRETPMAARKAVKKATKKAAKKTAKRTTRGRAQDRARVAGGQKYEVAYEAKKTKKKASTVRKAVKKVGNSRKKVTKTLRGRG